MGKRWKRNKKNKHTGEGKPRGPPNDKKDGTDQNEPNNPYRIVSSGNFKMEAYYAYQGLHDYYLDTETGEMKKCTTLEEKEVERQRWLTTLKETLPASFRIGNDVPTDLRETLEKELDSYVGQKMEITVLPKGGTIRIQQLDLKVERKMVSPVAKVPYIPHAYQLGIDRQTIRRNDALKPFFEWLKIQTAAGFVTRQETVSMIPPVVLNPQPHHKVLDMCAAPGSKTTQLLELVNIPVNPQDTEPTGLVVANDADSKRAYMLVHHLRRINSPAMFVSTCDAQLFPLLPSEEYPTEGMFDRVLCDVPCSGDGTARKNPGVWKSWNNLGAFGLHALQLAIALKGARMTKVGGYMCYSTCSMNPIENEAVVAELLRASEGSLVLVNRKVDMPGLKSRPGMSSWRVLSEDKSSRTHKNLAKKNSPKMQAKRKEWEEKQKQQGHTGLKGGDDDKSMTEIPSTSEQEDKEGIIDTATTTAGEVPATENIRVPVSTKFEPKSMSDAELKEMIAMSGLNEYLSYEEVPIKLRRRVRTTCFPPTSQEEISKFHLDYCMRILPQDMDTGGFFVTLLKKVAPMNARARKRFQSLEEELTAATTKTDGKGDGEEPNKTSSTVGNDDDDGEEPKLKKPKVDHNSDVATDARSTADDDGVAAGASSSAADIGTEEDNTGGDEEMEGGNEGDLSDVAQSSSAHGESNDGLSDVGLVMGEKNSEKVVRGQNKKNFLRDKDGKKHATLGRDDFVPFAGDLMAPLKEYYGLSSENFDETKYMIRAGSDAKVLYYMSDSIKQLIDQGIQQRVTVVHSGLKAFVRNNRECKVHYRIAQEGVQYVAPQMTKRKFIVSIDDFRKCLCNRSIPIQDVSTELAEQVRELDHGAFVVQLEGYEKDYLKKLSLAMWRCRSDAITAQVEQKELDGMKSKLRAITGEDEQEQQQQQQQGPTAPAPVEQEKGSTQKQAMTVNVQK